MRWLFFLPQLTNPAARVRVWRRLRGAGAVSLKGAVWALPDSPAGLASLRWVQHELSDEGAGGLIARVTLLEGLDDAALAAQFQATIKERWQALLAELGHGTAAQLPTLQRHFDQAAAADAFGSPLKARAARALERIAAGERLRAARSAPEAYRGRTWVTRRDVHVDRMASAWLIRRFIDPRARLRFVNLARYHHKPGELRFDLDGAEFTHQGARCTFEVLAHRFRPRDQRLRFLGELVHDLDFKDNRFGRPETMALGQQLTAIAAEHHQDVARLERAATVLDELYVLRAKR